MSSRKQNNTEPIRTTSPTAQAFILQSLITEGAPTLIKSFITRHFGTSSAKYTAGFDEILAKLIDLLFEMKKVCSLAWEAAPADLSFFHIIHPLFFMPNSTHPHSSAYNLDFDKFLTFPLLPQADLIKLKIVIGLFFLASSANMQKSYTIQKLQQNLDTLKFLLTSLEEMDIEANKSNTFCSFNHETIKNCPFNAFVQYVLIPKFGDICNRELTNIFSEYEDEELNQLLSTPKPPKPQNPNTESLHLDKCTQEESTQVDLLEFTPSPNFSEIQSSLGEIPEVIPTYPQLLGGSSAMITPIRRHKRPTTESESTLEDKYLDSDIYRASKISPFGGNSSSGGSTVASTPVVSQPPKYSFNKGNRGALLDRYSENVKNLNNIENMGDVDNLSSKEMLMLTRRGPREWKKAKLYRKLYSRIVREEGMQEPHIPINIKPQSMNIEKPSWERRVADKSSMLFRSKEKRMIIIGKGCKQSEDELDTKFNPHSNSLLTKMQRTLSKSNRVNKFNMNSQSPALNQSLSHKLRNALGVFYKSQGTFNSPMKKTTQDIQCRRGRSASCVTNSECLNAYPHHNKRTRSSRLSPGTDASREYMNIENMGDEGDIISKSIAGMQDIVIQNYTHTQSVDEESIISRRNRTDSFACSAVNSGGEILVFSTPTKEDDCIVTQRMGLEGTSRKNLSNISQVNDIESEIFRVFPKKNRSVEEIEGEENKSFTSGEGESKEERIEKVGILRETPNKSTRADQLHPALKMRSPRTPRSAIIIGENIEKCEGLKNAIMRNRDHSPDNVGIAYGESRMEDLTPTHYSLHATTPAPTAPNIIQQLLLSHPNNKFGTKYPKPPGPLHRTFHASNKLLPANNALGGNSADMEDILSSLTFEGIKAPQDIIRGVDDIYGQVTANDSSAIPHLAQFMINSDTRGVNGSRIDCPRGAIGHERIMSCGQLPTLMRTMQDNRSGTNNPFPSARTTQMSGVKNREGVRSSKTQSKLYKAPGTTQGMTAAAKALQKHLGSIYNNPHIARNMKAIKTASQKIRNFNSGSKMKEQTPSHIIFSSPTSPHMGAHIPESPQTADHGTALLTPAGSMPRARTSLSTGEALRNMSSSALPLSVECHLPKYCLEKMGKPPGRQEAVLLTHYMNEQIALLTPSLCDDTLSPSDLGDAFHQKQMLLSLCSMEVIRQVSVHCRERGELLQNIIHLMNSLHKQMLDTLSSKSCDKENMLVHAMQTIKLSTKKKISTREKFIVELEEQIKRLHTENHLLQEVHKNLQNKNKDLILKNDKLVQVATKYRNQVSSLKQSRETLMLMMDSQAKANKWGDIPILGSSPELPDSQDRAKLMEIIQRKSLARKESTNEFEALCKESGFNVENERSVRGNSPAPPEYTSVESTPPDTRKNSTQQINPGGKFLISPLSTPIENKVFNFERPSRRGYRKSVLYSGKIEEKKAINLKKSLEASTDTISLIMTLNRQTQTNSDDVIRVAEGEAQKIEDSLQESKETINYEETMGNNIYKKTECQTQTEDLNLLIMEIVKEHKELFLPIAHTGEESPKKKIDCEEEGNRVNMENIGNMENMEDNTLNRENLKRLKRGSSGGVPTLSLSVNNPKSLQRKSMSQIIINPYRRRKTLKDIREELEEEDNLDFSSASSHRFDADEQEYMYSTNDRIKALTQKNFDLKVELDGYTKYKEEMLNKVKVLEKGEKSRASVWEENKDLKERIIEMENEIEELDECLQGAGSKKSILFAKQNTGRKTKDRRKPTDTSLSLKHKSTFGSNRLDLGDDEEEAEVFIWTISQQDHKAYKILSTLFEGNNLEKERTMTLKNTLINITGYYNKILKKFEEEIWKPISRPATPIGSTSTDPKKQEFPPLVELVYDGMTQMYGLGAFAEKKFTQFIKGLKEHSEESPRILLFWRLLGLVESNKLDFEDLKLYTKGLSYIKSIANERSPGPSPDRHLVNLGTNTMNAQASLNHYCSEATALNFILELFQDLLPSENVLQLQIEIKDLCKERMSEEKKITTELSAGLIDIDLFLGCLIEKFNSAIHMRGKDQWLEIFNAADLTSNYLIERSEFAMVMKHFELMKLEDAVRIFNNVASKSVKTNKGMIEVLNFKQFSLLCFELKLLSIENQTKFLLVSDEKGLESKVRNLQMHFSTRIQKISQRFNALHDLSNTYYYHTMYKNIKELSNKTMGCDQKKFWIMYRILEEESKDTFLNNSAERYLGSLSSFLKFRESDDVKVLKEQFFSEQSSRRAGTNIDISTTRRKSNLSYRSNISPSECSSPTLSFKSSLTVLGKRQPPFLGKVKIKGPGTSASAKNLFDTKSFTELSGSPTSIDRQRQLTPGNQGETNLVTDTIPPEKKVSSTTVKLSTKGIL